MSYKGNGAQGRVSENKKNQTIRGKFGTNRTHQNAPESIELSQTFRFLPRITVCSARGCHRRYVRGSRTAASGFCSYGCGVAAQPEHTKRALTTTGQGSPDSDQEASA